MDEVILDESQPERRVFMGAFLDPKIKNKMVAFLWENMGCFARPHSSMTWISESMITQKLNVEEGVKPVK